MENPLLAGRWRGNSSIALAAGLDVVRVDARRTVGREASLVRLLAAVVVDVLKVEGVDMAGNVPEDREADIDKQVCGWSASPSKHPVERHIPIPHPATAHTPRGGTAKRVSYSSRAPFVAATYREWL